MTLYRGYGLWAIRRIELGLALALHLGTGFNALIVGMTNKFWRIALHCKR